MSNEIEEATVRDARLARFGRAQRNGGLGSLHPTVMEFLPHTLRGHGVRPRAFQRDGKTPYRQAACVESGCVLNRPKGIAHADRGRNVDEWLDLVKG